MRCTIRWKSTQGWSCPWNRQAMITSLVPGKIDKVLVRPGETVRAGRELARIESMELESLQLDLLRAAGEVDLAKRLVRQRQGLEAEGGHPGQDPPGDSGRTSREDGRTEYRGSETPRPRHQRGNTPETSRRRQADAIHLDYEPHRRRCHARRRSYWPDGEADRSPLPRRRSVEGLDRRRGPRIRRAASQGRPAGIRTVRSLSRSAVRGRDRPRPG